jgi:NADPH:quinone reductase
MRALTTPDAAVADVPEPTPAPSEALVRVRAISINRGEIRSLALRDPGLVHGWDLSGVVERAAADGSGPSEGARVVGIMGMGAWAELVAVPTTGLAQLPDEVSFEQAAALPVAGLTPLKALDVAGNVLGRRVLITGASGGVGRFAIQLAKLAGAHVTAIARRQEGLAELGADEVSDTIAGPRFDLVIDAVGGDTFGEAVQHLAPGGTLVSIAATVDSDVSFHPRDLYNGATGARIYGLMIFDEHEGAKDFDRLLRLVADGRVDPQIDRVDSWANAADAIAAVKERRINGKVVLTVD